MKSNLKCEVVRDILPLYVDNLTSEVTNKEIEKHLNECKECKGVELMMRNEIVNEQAKTLDKEVDFLKKIKKNTKKSIIMTMAICVSIMIAIFATMFIKECVIGKEIEYWDGVLYSVDVEGKEVNLTVNTGDDKIKVTRFEAIEEDGVVKYNIFVARRAIVKESDDCLFNGVHSFSTDVKKIYLGDELIYQEGKQIVEFVEDMFSSKIDTGLNKAQLKKLEDIINVTSAYHLIDSSEIISEEGKYGIKYVTYDSNTAKYTDEEIQTEMRNDSCYLLACIRELDYVSWQYEMDGEMKNYTVTSNDINKTLKMGIKEYGESIDKLQMLFDYLAFGDEEDFDAVDYVGEDGVEEVDVRLNK